MQYVRTTEKYQDAAGKWRLRVQVNETDTMFLKFEEEPTEQQVAEKTAQLIFCMECEILQRACKNAKG